MHQIITLHLSLKSAGEAYSRGIVDEYVDATEFAYSFIDSFLNILLIPQIALDGQSFSTSLFN